MNVTGKKHSKGFTLVEGMITIAMLAILASIAIPSFADIYRQNRVITQANTIISALNYARNETINQNANVEITPVSSAASGSNWIWSAGLTVTSGGNVLRQFDELGNATVIVSEDDVTYQSDGTIDSDNNITLTLTPTNCPTGKAYIRQITIGLSGKANMVDNNCS